MRETGGHYQRLDVLHRLGCVRLDDFGYGRAEVGYRLGCGAGHFDTAGNQGGCHCH